MDWFGATKSDLPLTEVERRDVFVRRSSRSIQKEFGATEIVALVSLSARSQRSGSDERSR